LLPRGSPLPVVSYVVNRIETQAIERALHGGRVVSIRNYAANLGSEGVLGSTMQQRDLVSVMKQPTYQTLADKQRAAYQEDAHPLILPLTAGYIP
jgi:hypothetical protein